MWPLFKLGSHSREFQALSKAQRLGGRTRDVVLSIACIIAGVGILGHQGWGRVLALGVLAISAVYDANPFAWSFAGGPPSEKVRILSRILSVVWKGGFLRTEPLSDRVHIRGDKGFVDERFECSGCCVS